MFLKQLAAAGLMASIGTLAGCQMGPPSTPAASAPVTTVNQADVAALEQNWRSTHPNTMVGHVIAVDPIKRIAEVTGIPDDQAQIGNVITVLLDNRGTATLQGVVYAKADGYLQLDYTLPSSGDRAPRMGDLAVLFPASPSIPSSEMNAGEPAGQGVVVTPGAPDSAMPATMPADASSAAPAAPSESSTAAPPETQPAGAPAETQPAAPAAPAETQPAAPPETQPSALPETQPAAPAGTEPAPAPPAGATTEQGATGTTGAGTGGTTTETPQAPAGGNNTPRDLNK